MEFAKQIFSKPLTEITYSDVEDFFKLERVENDFIEFKSFSGNNFDKALQTIREEICSYLNSDGGLIIWGAPKGITKEGQKEKVFTGSLTPITQLKEKDSLINTISDTIHPLPNSIRIQLIHKPNETDKIILIEVDKSISAPHQIDGKYFIRLDGQVRGAPHRYVEALMKEVKFPDLRTYIQFINVEAGSNALRLNIHLWVWNLSPLINEEDVVIRLACKPGEIEHHSSDGLVRRNEIILPCPLLSYGMPYSVPLFINLPALELPSTNYIVEILARFHGKKSPSKITEYNVKVDSTMSTLLLNKNLTFISENNLLTDVEEKKGLRHKDIIEKRIGRSLSDQ